MDRFGVLCATCAYLGYVPIAPGTFGSALGLILFWAVRSTGSAGVEAAVMTVLFAVGVWSGTVAERHFRGVDPGPVVIDEVFGMLVTLAFLPVSMTGAIIGFFVFRLLDIVKPWPARRSRVVARRARHHGRRRHGRDIRQSAHARAHRHRAGMARVIHRAAILAVGSELLTPIRIDTNSLMITEQLERLGVEVIYKGVVGDDRREVAAAVRVALERVDLLVCCGGLGPTDDDVTREAVAEVLGRVLVEDERIVAQIEARFAARRIQMPAINRRQAMVPSGASVIDNSNGTAPGLWLEENGRSVLLLPGPPRELRAMLAWSVERLLEPRSSGLALVRRVIRITNRTESQTEETVQPLYAAVGAADDSGVGHHTGLSRAN